MTQEAKARSVLKEVLESKESDFYRRKYGDAGGEVARGAPWTRLPFLERAEIQALQLADRLYKPREDLYAIRPTSGTSGKGVLLMPRGKASSKNVVIFEELYASLGVTRAVSFSGAQFLYGDNFRDDLHFDSIALDVSNLELAEQVIASYCPDMLMGFAYVLSQLAPRLGQEISSQIKAVEVFGEWCSSIEWKALHDAFPNAVLFSEYASIDAQTLLCVACKDIAKKGDQTVHPISEYVYLELVDANGDAITAPGIEGEVVITVLRDVAFPLIRYRTGDAAVIHSLKCTCTNEGPVIAMRGRLAEDRVRFYGGEVSVAEVDRALSKLASDFGAQGSFTVVYKEVGVEGGPRPSLTVKTAWDPLIAAERFADALARELRVRHAFTYAMGVEKEGYIPLHVERGEENTSGKRQRIVRDKTL